MPCCTFAGLLFGFFGFLFFGFLFFGSFEFFVLGSCKLKRVSEEEAEQRDVMFNKPHNSKMLLAIRLEKI